MAAHSKNQNTIATPIISSNSFKLSSFTSLPIFGCPLVSSPASVLQQLHMLLKLILGYKMLFFRAVTVFKPKPKTAVLRRNRTETEPRFSGGHVTVFLEFQKWPSPVTNVPNQQPNYRLRRTHASTV